MPKTFEVGVTANVTYSISIEAEDEVDAKAQVLKVFEDTPSYYDVDEIEDVEVYHVTAHKESTNE